MLASPLLPVPIFSAHQQSDDSTPYRPSRDLETFNSLLPPPIEFIEGPSSGSMTAPPESKYQPINSPGALKPSHLDPSSPSSPSSAKPTPHSAHLPSSKTSLYPSGVDVSWPASFNRGSGLHNTGNTCFLNSALQCLLHTPPLLRILLVHQNDTCRVEKVFCMTCSLRQVAVQSHTSKFAFTPASITNRLQTIAKHMRRGRQEDTHEFLRYAIDALQKSCLAGYSPKIDPELAETTWVHKIFGGRLRSRVTCNSCGHNSDTFDRMLDLSLDILKVDTLKDALRKFVAVDHLIGADKYKCEKCKKHVIAEKRFTIHESPVVLTVHLKRFSPVGRKIAHHIDYEDHLTVQPYMSEGCYGLTYSLYGVICHAGGGPNSGHYYAYIKSRDGKWWEMNDESVSLLTCAPTTKKNAYMLFYIRNKGQGLEAAIKSSVGLLSSATKNKAGLVSGMKKRPQRSRTIDAEDQGVTVTKPFTGPMLLSTSSDGTSPDAKRPRLSTADPQALKIRTKIIEAQAKSTLASLVGYDSDSYEPSERHKEQDHKSDVARSDEVVDTTQPSSLPPTMSPTSLPVYAPLSSDGKKRKLSENREEQASLSYVREPLPVGSRTAGYRVNAMMRNNLNPFNRPNTYSKKHRRRLMSIYDHHC